MALGYGDGFRRGKLRLRRGELREQQPPGKYLSEGTLSLPRRKIFFFPLGFLWAESGDHVKGLWESFDEARGMDAQRTRCWLTDIGLEVLRDETLRREVMLRP